MSLSVSLGRDGTAMHPVTLLALGELVLTSVHHGYGALIYTAPFRLQVVIYSAVAAALILALAFAAARHRGQLVGRVAFWAEAALVFAFPIVSIGFVEGGYNHVVKNIVHLTGNAALYAQMFPAGIYEAPGDWFFEASGMLQFPVAVAALWLGIRAWRGR